MCLKAIAMRDHSSRLAATLFWGDACCEDLLVAFFCLLLLNIVVRSKEYWGESHVVVGPLSLDLVEERAVMAVRAKSEWLAWDFDETKGYPGEDGILL